jgi:hypothetical protein
VAGHAYIKHKLKEFSGFRVRRIFETRYGTANEAIAMYMFAIAMLEFFRVLK